MLTRSTRLNPLSRLRPKIGLIVFGVIGALALFMTQYFGERLTNSYREAGRSELNAIASMWDNAFRLHHLDRPGRIQARIDRLRDQNETLHKISLSWQDPADGTMLVSSGHSHDPDGTKRDVTTGRVLRLDDDPGNPAPIDEANWRYHEKRAADGAHYGELNFPLRRTRGGSEEIVAALELHYDLKALDLSLARDKRTLALAAALAAVTAALLVSLLLGRTVLAPLDRLRAAANRIRSGDVDVRLNWNRGDEMGALAQDFDRMAEELGAVHRHLETLALTDPLTGLLNHRAFQERLSQELRRAEREGYSVSIVALDVDYFKEINDRHGHASGDGALRALAAAIRAEVRPSDVCGRVGGDEFMLAIVRSSVEDTERIVDRLRASVADMQFGPAGESLTLSAGISEFPSHSLSQEELMHLADGAMYWAKSHGRNRTFVYSADRDFALSAEEAADRVARDGLINTVHALAKAVDAKDGYTHSHSQRVARYAAALAREIGMDPERVEKIRTAGVLHDVGKIGISDVLLLHPGKLDEEGFATMRRHSELGRDIIAGAGMDDVADFVLYLHERWDGGGYPAGLAGEQIPIESRVLHVADALEAMTSSRVYRRALSLDVALGELEEKSGSQFDPRLAPLLVELVHSGAVEVIEGEGEDVPASPLGAAEAAETAAGAGELAGVLAGFEDGDGDAGSGRAGAHGAGHGVGADGNGGAHGLAANRNGGGHGHAAFHAHEQGAGANGNGGSANGNGAAAGLGTPSNGHAAVGPTRGPAPGADGRDGG